jgi:serine/threonine protein kinase
MPLGLHTAELNFETLKEIGQEGRNSTVFLAHDKQLDGEIVVKIVPKTKLPNANDFYREAKILYASSHPYVVRVNYGCADNDNIYMAMPYYKNGSLKQLIDTRFLTIREVLRYSIQFLSGLNNIHSKGLLHFDIKPDNILLSDSNEALLSDFGLSKAMDNFGFANPDGIYPKQVPPETFASTQKTLHFDIYLAGLTIYRLLNGNEHYYNQLTYGNQQDYINAIRTGNFPNRDSYLPHVPLKLQRIINRALSIDIADRHQTVLELINDLSSVDENLDWQFSSTINSRTWTKALDDKTYELTLDFTDNRNQTIQTYKTMHQSGNRTRVNDHCHNNLNNSNVLSKLKKGLREL